MLGLSFILRFLLTLTFARFLDPNQLGIYSWSVTAFGIMGIIVNFGLDFFLIRKIPEYRNKNISKIGSVIQHTKEQTKFNTILVSSIIIPLGYFSAYFFEGATQYNSELMIITLALPFAAYLMIFSTSLRAFDEPLTGQFIESILQTAILLIAVLIFFNVFNSVTPEYKRTLQLVGLFLFSWISSCFIAGYIYKKKLNLSEYSPAKRKNTKDWRKDQATIMFGVLGWSFLGRSDVFLLAFLVPPSDVGGYFICIRLAETLMFFGSVSYYVWGGEISNLIQQSKLGKAQEILRKSSQLCFTTTFIMTLIAWIYAAEILYFMNEQFVDYELIFKGALLVFFLKGSQGILNPIYYILGEQTFLAKLQWIVGLFFTVSVILTVPIYGISACIMSLGICQAIYLLILVFRLKFKHGLSMLPF